MSDIVTKIDLADKNGVLLHTEKKYCRRNILVIPRLKPLEISENGTYPVPQGCAGHGQVSVNVVPKKEASLVITGNGAYTAPPGTVYTSIVVNVPTSSGGEPEGGEGETPHVHKYTSEVIAPSCTIGGYTMHTCECGHSYQSDETAPLGHKYVNGVCEVCGAADPNYKPSNPDVNAGQYNLIVGDMFSISYEGSSPTVECPYCLTYQDDGGELVFTAVAVGSGTIYIRVSDTLIASYTVVVTAVATYDYNLKIGDNFSFDYHGSSPTVECPACLTYYIDGGTIVFTAAKVGAGTLRLYDSDTLIAVFTIQVAAQESGGDDTHIHSYTATVIPPTCTAGGYTQHTCACGNSYRTDEVDPNGHDWRIGWQQVTAATCTASGKDKRVCFTCGCEETRTVAALGHDWDKDNPVEYGNGLAYKCVRCGAYDPIPDESCDHSWSGWTIDFPAYCEDDGEKHRTCTKCYETETEYIEALGHRNTTYYPREEPTCTVNGHTQYTVCNDCGKVISGSNTILTAKHTPQTITGYAATCTAPGKTNGVVCSVCGTTITAQEEIPKIQHRMESAWSVYESPTCTDPGIERRYCSNCNYYESRAIAATGHSYTSKVTPATCEEGGYTTYTCSKCGHSYTGDETDPNGHNFAGGWVVTTDPTCTAKGVETRTCMTCGHKDTRNVPALGHDWGSPEYDDSYSSGQSITCERCGETEEYSS